MRNKKSRVKQGKSSVPVEELTREELLEMNQWLEMELEYTKKASGAQGRTGASGQAGSLRREPSAQERYLQALTVSELRDRYPLSDLLAISGLARSTYYYQLSRLRAASGETRLKVLIRKLFDRHKGRYGYRRITAALRRIGEVVNRRRVQRLMQQMQLKSVVRPKRYRAYRGAVGLAAPNLLQRDFSSEKPPTEVGHRCDRIQGGREETLPVSGAGPVQR